MRFSSALAAAVTLAGCGGHTCLENYRCDPPPDANFDVALASDADADANVHEADAVEEMPDAGGAGHDCSDSADARGDRRADVGPDAVDGADARDAATEERADAGTLTCQSFPVGPQVAVTTSSAPLPAFLGGAIGDGKYFLNEYTIHGADAGDAGGFSWGTIAFREGQIFLAQESRGGTIKFVGTYMNSAASLTAQTSACSDAGAASLTYDYTATGSTIVLHEPASVVVTTWTLSEL